VETERRGKEETGEEKEGKRQRRSTKGERQRERDRRGETKDQDTVGGKRGIYRGETVESNRAEI
jgi:hypothetical protein